VTTPARQGGADGGTEGTRLAVITGASTGIGYELARCAAEDGCALIVAADEDAIHAAAETLRVAAPSVTAVEADLASAEGLEQLWAEMAGRRIDYLCANAGIGLGHAFLEQEEARIGEVIGLNVTGTTALLHRAIRTMRAQGAGRILVTGSIAGLMPGSYQAVYNATKAYIDTLAWGVRDELDETAVTITCLMPGPTDTEFFHRGGMDDTPVGRSGSKTDPATVARAGYAAMKRGASGVSPGAMARVQAALSGIVPDGVLARLHRQMAEPEGDRHGR